MPENNTILFISAFSGLAGAILAQSVSGLITYFSDKRKKENETRTAYRNKKTDIGENFYYVTSEKVGIIRAHIHYWKKREFIDSEISLAFLNQEMKKLGEHLERLNADGWKYNLINLYYKVTLNHNSVIQSNALSQAYYLKFLDVIDAFKKAHDDETKNELQGRYAEILFEMCHHYEGLSRQMEQDMERVKNELLQEFGLSVPCNQVRDNRDSTGILTNRVS
jgi:hypothetical protein